MRKPSRLMPEYVRQQPGIFGWLLVAVFLLPFIIALGYAFYRFPWVTGVIVTIALMVTVIANQNFKARLGGLAAVRGNDSICSFAKSFDTREVDTWVIRAVYEQLQHYLSSTHPEFPVRAEDTLDGCLISDSEDLDLDLVQEIAERTGRSLENADRNPYYGKVRTARDLVLFFNAQPFAQNHLAEDR
jgi:hypothetical protein